MQKSKNEFEKKVKNLCIANSVNYSAEEVISAYNKVEAGILVPLDLYEMQYHLIKDIKEVIDEYTEG